MTFKKAILRGLLGAPLGVFISTTIGLIYSLVFNQLLVISPMDSSINPVTAYLNQYIISMVIGFTFASGSAIFEIENWSIARQTIVHFIITSVIFLPCSIKAGWISPWVPQYSINKGTYYLSSIAVYLGIFIIIYGVVWLSEYLFWKNKIKNINKKLENR